MRDARCRLCARPPDDGQSGPIGGTVGRSRWSSRSGLPSLARIAFLQPVRYAAWATAQWPPAASHRTEPRGGGDLAFAHSRQGVVGPPWLRLGGRIRGAGGEFCPMDRPVAGRARNLPPAGRPVIGCRRTSGSGPARPVAGLPRRCRRHAALPGALAARLNRPGSRRELRPGADSRGCPQAGCHVPQAAMRDRCRRLSWMERSAVLVRRCPGRRRLSRARGGCARSVIRTHHAPSKPRVPCRLLTAVTRRALRPSSSRGRGGGRRHAPHESALSCAHGGTRCMAGRPPDAQCPREQRPTSSVRTRRDGSPRHRRRFAANPQGGVSEGRTTAPVR